MHKVIGIHGAFSSPRIFSYLKLKTKRTSHWECWDYSGQTGGLSNLLASFPTPAEPHHVVGHSMGGIIALQLAQQPWVQSVTTISTPLGGFDMNLFQTMTSRSDFMDDLRSTGDIIRRIMQLKATAPVQHLISTRGFHPWLYEPNDGVITLRSQTAWRVGAVHEIAANHAEIMLSDETVACLDGFWR